MTPEQAKQAVSDRAIVRLFYAPDPTDTHAVGQIVGYTNVPAVIVETADGEQIAWRHDLAEVVATTEEAR